MANFIKSHADVEGPILAWLNEAEDAHWPKPNDIKKRYASASFIGNNRVVFNIKGKKYRLDVKVAYETKTVLIVRIGTHAEYNSWKF